MSTIANKKCGQIVSSDHNIRHMHFIPMIEWYKKDSLNVDFHHIWTNILQTMGFYRKMWHIQIVLKIKIKKVKNIYIMILVILQ